MSDNFHEYILRNSQISFLIKLIKYSPHTRIHAYTYICIHIHTHTHTYIHGYIYIHIGTYMYIYIYTYTYAYAHIYMYISTSIAYAHPVESVNQMCTLMFATEQKFWTHRSTSTQPPIILPLRLSHEGFQIFLKPRNVNVTFSATKKSSLH